LFRPIARAVLLCKSPYYCNSYAGAIHEIVGKTAIITDVSNAPW
jgi:hypothetical protein